MIGVTQDFIRGALHIDGQLETKCFTSWQEFLEALPSLLSVELPAGFSGIIVQSQAPSESDRLKLWARTDSVGGFNGLFAFQQGSWKPFYTGHPQQVTWFYGDSNGLKGSGFELIDEGDTEVPPYVVSVIKASYVPLANNPKGYAYFAVRYVGF